MCLSAVSGRSLRDAAAQAPTAAAAGDAIVGIVDPTGVTSAMFPVVDGSDLKVPIQSLRLCTVISYLAAALSASCHKSSYHVG